MINLIEKLKQNNIEHKTFFNDRILSVNADCFQAMEMMEDKNIVYISDPPYNMNYHYNTYKDNLKEKEYLDWIYSIFFDRKAIIIHYPEMLYKIAIKFQYAPEKVISWVYNAHTPKQHRDIAFFNIKPDLNKVKQPFKNQKDKRIIKKIADGIEGCRLYDWWNINQVKNVSKEKTQHPCQIPTELMSNIIGIIDNDNIICDPFSGSGTTALACASLNRRCIAIELDADYYKIGNDRLHKLQLEKEGDLFYEA